jgi:hypothetical protein
MKKRNPGDYTATVSFGEYASPDFDSIVEVVGKAKSYGIMSLEQCIDELYGDSWTDEEKALEVQRIRQGDTVIDEPAAWVDGLNKGEQEVQKDEEVIDDEE